MYGDSVIIHHCGCIINHHGIIGKYPHGIPYKGGVVGKYPGGIIYASGVIGKYPECIPYICSIISKKKKTIINNRGIIIRLLHVYKGRVECIHK